MNRFAALIIRLETLNDAGMKAALVEDYLRETPELDRGIACKILENRLRVRPVKLALIRGLADSRTDPVLFELAQSYVGDVGETIALTWIADRRANRDPSLGEIIEGLSTLGRSELPKRIEAWLDACDEAGRWVLIKLLTGALRVGDAPAVTAPEQRPQRELFRTPPNKDTAGTINAVLLYAERTNTRARSSPLRCTFGVWTGDTLAPVAICQVSGNDAAPIESFIEEYTTARFGPVREVRHDREVALVAELTFAAIAATPRRKAGVTLRAAQVRQTLAHANPSDAATLDTLEQRLRSP